MKMKNYITVVLVQLLFATTALSQMPQINSVDKRASYPGDTIVISGSNFSANPAELRVSFGAVSGEIISATPTLLQVRVPEETHFDYINVTNLVSGLTAYSSGKFYTNYSGDPEFNPSEFSAPLSFNAKEGEKEFYDLCSCDLNDDGKPDIIATKFESPAVDMVVLKNNSTPENISFTQLSGTEIPNLNVGAPTSNVICSDLNGDGKPDVIASRSGSTRNEVFVLQNTSTGGNISFAPLRRLVMNAMVKSRRIAVSDLNFDGRPEVVVTNVEGATVNIFVNNSTKTNVSFEATPTSIDINGAENSSGIEIQDLNADRKPDIIVTQFFKDNVYILKNNSTSGTISFNEQQVLTLMGNPLLNVKTADIDSDGLPDIVASSTSGDRLIIFPNTSATDISFGSPVSLTTGKGPWGIDMADMNGEGKVDIIVGNQNQAQVNVLINNSTPGTFTFTADSSITTDLNTRNVLANDFDGDGKPDLAFTAFMGTTGPFKLEILRNLNCFVPRFVTEENLAICPGQEKILEAVPNVTATYEWLKDGATVKTGPENFLNITESGDYTVVATTESGTCSIDRTYTVLDGTGTIPGDPEPSSNTPVCEGESINLTVQEITGAVYKWTGPDGFTSDLREPVIADASPGNAGLYTVTIKIGQCLSSEKSTAVDVVILPVFTAGAQGPVNFCEGTTNQLSVTQRAGYSYQWYNSGQIITGATGTTYNATASGNYYAMVTDDGTGCTLNTNEIALNAYTPPTAAFTLSSTTVCTEVQVITTNTSTVDPDATPVYSWNYSNGAVSSERAPVFSYSQAGNFNPQLTVSYEGVAGCSSTSSQAVTVVAATMPVITSSTTEICPEEPLELSVAGTFSEVNWSTGESGNAITVNEAGVFTVTTVDNNGCPGEDDLEVILKPAPAMQVTASTENIPSTADTIKVVPGEVNLSATGADTYSWAPAEFLDNPSVAEPVATVKQSVTFYVTGTLINGCSAMDSIYVIVNTGGELPISPRKVFSPESTRNPTWDIDLSFLNETCNLTLFDDRGMKILENSGQMFTWNGSINGQPLPEGVYYYIVGCPEGGKKAGTVLLVRN
jgi:gliding motility-associated-like protein